MQRHKSLDHNIHKINLDKTLKTGLVQVYICNVHKQHKNVLATNLL
jgi:hypothetical protein